MNVSDDFPEIPGMRRHSRPAEFCRWIVVAGISSIVGSGAMFVADRLATRDYPILFFPIVWASFSAGEAWVQFRPAKLRLKWVHAGAVTGWCLWFYFRHVPVRTGWNAALFLIPAGIECASAWRYRKRAWIWLLLTPSIYLSVGNWESKVDWLVSSFLLRLQNLSGLSAGAPGKLAVGACVLGVIVFSRALVGSFIACRKDE